MRDLTEPGVVELRRYTVPGGRETLIELFEAELLVPQEDVGMLVMGQFRDVHDPDAFVWFRGFADMVTRRRGLEAFYGGPVWARHRDAANATMVDSDDVLLLRPLGRVATDGAASRPGRLLIATWTLIELPEDRVLARWAAGNAERLAAVGGALHASLATEPSVNDFPRLPVRDGAHAVTVSRHDAELADPALDPPGELEDLVTGPPSLTWLAPTERSAWRA